MLKRLKIFSVIALVLSLILPICVSAYQDETDLPSGITESPISEAPLYVDYSSRDMIPVEALANAELSPQDIPEALRVRNADTSKYAHRVYNLEDEYSLVYQNSDGTNTMLQFTEPIQYRDSDGNLKDISTAMLLVGKDYVMLDNDVFVKIPNNLSDGVKFEIDGLKLSMKPFGALADIGSVSKLTDSAEKLSASTSKYSYSGIYGSDTAIVYSPLFDGVKCDIILQQYINKNEFEFEVELNGFNLEKDENEKIIYILDSSGDRVAFFGTVMSYDVMGNVSFGDMNFKELGDDKYLVILSVDEEFLTDPDTVYPVTVDPTVRECKTNDVPTFFEYLCVYSNGTTIHSMSNTTADMCVGTSPKGIGRVLYKFHECPFPMKSMSSVKIIQCVRAYPTYAMYAYPFTGNYWSDTSSYNNIAPDNYDTLYSINVSYGAYYGTNTKIATMDVTSFYNECGSSTYPYYSRDKGVILVNTVGEQPQPPQCIAITSCDIDSPNSVRCFKPYAELTYEPYKIMLDPGHSNSTTSFATYNYNGITFEYAEGTQMWKIYTYLRQNLERMGFYVGVTRSETDDPGYPDRGNMAHGYDMFLSLHSNATNIGNYMQTSKSHIMYEYVEGESQEVIDFADNIATSVKNVMNISQANYPYEHNHKVLVYAKMSDENKPGCPISILIEHSYHDNPQYGYMLTQSSTHSAIAEAEANVIYEFFKAKN